MFAVKQQQTVIIGIIEEYNRNGLDEEEPFGMYRGRLIGSKSFQRSVSFWIKDYVDQNPTYPDTIFKRRFSIPRVFYYILKEDLLRHRSGYWKQKVNVIGHKCIPKDLKILSALRILSTGCASDNLDDCVYMAEKTIRQYFTQFCIDVIEIYGGLFYNRFPTKEELMDIEQRYTEIGFPGCIGGCVLHEEYMEELTRGNEREISQLLGI